MKALILTILGLWTLSIGAWVWVEYFDSAVREPVVGPATPTAILTDKTPSVPRPADPAERAGLPGAAAAAAVSVAPAAVDTGPTLAMAPAKLDPRPAPAAPLSYDVFGKPPPDPALALRAREKKAVRLEGLRAELAADSNAFASRYGLTPQQVQQIQSGKVPMEWVLQNAHEKY